MSAQERTIGGGEVLEGRYRIISEGIPQDLGLVYKAYDMRHDRLVEVLVLAQHFGGGMGLLSRIIQANQAVADLQQPTLIPFEHAGLVDERLYLVRGPAAGRPLADLLSRLGSLKVDVAIEIAVRLCEALAPLHRAGLVHGGLSPYSVLVRVADQDAGDPRAPGSERRLGRAVAVVDAGLLPALRPVPSPPDRPWGRFPYISPEQAAGEDIHPASDVYAIGSLLYEMLSGRPPFRAADRTVLVLQHLRQDPPSLQILVPQVPLPLSQIVQKALAKEPSARYRNASQLAHILRSQLALRLLEPATPHRIQAVGRLIVPPPPAPGEMRAAPLARPVTEVYNLGSEADEWDEDSKGLDWLLIGLLILALIAVLGLIPLWRTVYRRYTVPPPVLAPSSYLDTDSSPPDFGSLSRSKNAPAGFGNPPRAKLDLPSLELDGFRLVWYNWPWLRTALVRTVPDLPTPGSKSMSMAGVGVRWFVARDGCASLGV
jgi:serine/threonine protein kinase